MSEQLEGKTAQEYALAALLFERDSLLQEEQRVRIREKLAEDACDAAEARLARVREDKETVRARLEHLKELLSEIGYIELNWEAERTEDVR